MLHMHLPPVRVSMGMQDIEEPLAQVLRQMRLTAGKLAALMSGDSCPSSFDELSMAVDELQNQR